MDSNNYPDIQAPTNPQFFKPILPTSFHELNIPVAFYEKYIRGKHEGYKVILMSVKTNSVWEAKMDGRRLTTGWNAFAVYHDLKVGDVLVFTDEGDLHFNVTAFGPSCYQVEYINTNQFGDAERFAIIEDAPEDEDANFFKLKLTAVGLNRNRVYLPSKFAKDHGLLDNSTRNVYFRDENSNKWMSELRPCVDDRLLFVGGWREFCTAKKLRVGDSCTFTLNTTDNKLFFQVFIPPFKASISEEREGSSKKKHMGGASSSKKTKHM